MSISTMTSKERVLAAIMRRPVDYVPCVPSMNIQAEDQRWGKTWQFPFGPSTRETIDYMVNELGTDQVVYLSWGFFPEPEVSENTWLENGIIHKKFITPSGEIHASIRYDEHWLHGLDIPFFSDYNPSHFVEPWVKSEADIQCLRHIMCPPRTYGQLEKLKFSLMEQRALADNYNLALGFYHGLGLTGAVNLFGPTEVCTMVADRIELVDAYLELEHQCNMANYAIALDWGVDFVYRNGFYETTDLFSPDILKHLLSQRLKEEIGIVHQQERPMAYSMLTGIMPLLDNLADLEIDCLVHPDVFYKNMDAVALKDKLGARTSFWTGPSDTIHMPWSKPEAVRQAVRHVMEVFGKTGLLITPCSSAKAVFPWINVLAMIDEWKNLRAT